MKNKSRQSGFSLIELSIVLVISGIMMGAAIEMVKPYVEQARLTNTHKKLDRISDALASYAQTYGRLPCPSPPNGSEPFGSPRGSGSNGDDVATADCGAFPTGYVGVVPFRAISLHEEDIRDGYGNLITYAVNPTMTQFNSSLLLDQADLAINPGTTKLDPTNIANYCITNKWLDDGAVKKLYKARVCCPNPTTNQLQVVDGKGSSVSVVSSQAMITSPPTVGPGPWKSYQQEAADGTFDSTGNYEYKDCQSRDRFLTNGAPGNDAGVKNMGYIMAGNFFDQFNSGVSLDQSSIAIVQRMGAGHGPQAYIAQQVVFSGAHPWDQSGTMPSDYISRAAPTGYSSINFCATRRQTDVVTQAPPVAAAPISVVAYVILSHGKNGDGAYIENSASQKPVTVSTNAQENENENGDMVFVDHQIQKSDSDDYFDDIVQWRTNDQLVSNFDNDSCARP